MPAVRVLEPDRMNLFGLFLRPLLNRALQDHRRYKRIRTFNGTFVLRAGRMAVTLTCLNGDLTLTRGAVDKPSAAVEGSLEAFLNLALGQSPVRALLRRQIKVRGSARALLRLRGLLGGCA